MKKAMDKPTKKRESYNPAVIKALREEFGFTTQFIRQCIRKDRDSLTADTIRRKYNEMASASIKAIEKFKKQPL